MDEIPEFPAPKTPRKSKDGYEYATYVSDRHPPFKIHNTKGQAHAAVNYRRVYYGDRKMSADVVLYRRIVGMAAEWEPQHSWNKGDVVTHLPWQPAPPSPEEKRRKNAHVRIEGYLNSVVESARKELDGEESDMVFEVLCEARNRVLDILRRSM